MRACFKIFLLLGLCFWMLVPRLWAQDDTEEKTESPWVFYGDVGTYHALRSAAPYDWMTSRTRARFTLRYHQKDVRLYTSAYVTYHAFIKEYTGVFPREVYLDYSTKHFGIRAGRQIIIRGVADGLQLNDVVSPLDLTEFLAQEYDDIRIPVNAIRIFYLSEMITVEAMLIPTFQGYKLPLEKRNPWSPFKNSSYPVSIDSDNEPTFQLRNMEYGAQVSFNLPGIDFAFTGLYGWNKMPTYQARLASDWSSVILSPQYARKTVLGFDISKPLDEFVFRGETAYTIGELYNAPNLLSAPHKKDHIQALIGIDWYAPNSWMLSAQGSYDRILNYKDNEIEAKEHSILATARISKKLFNDLFSISSFGYFDVLDNSLFNRFTLAYQITDGLQLSAGYDLFHGDNGRFKRYKDNSEIWAEIVYKF